MFAFLNRFFVVSLSIFTWAGMSALAWAGEWQGTWETSLGDFSMIENNRVVYGDFGPFGTLEGIVSDNRQYVRINIERKVGTGTFDGFIELRRAGGDMGGLFEGHYKRRADVSKLADMPSAFAPWPRGAVVKGRQTSSAKPSLSRYSGSQPSKNGLRANGGPIFSSWTDYPDAESRAAYVKLRGEAVKKRKRSDAIKKIRKNTPKPIDPPKMPEPMDMPDINARYNGPLASKIPVLKEYPADFDPKWIEVKLRRVYMDTSDDKGKEEIYGLTGLYFGCEIASGQAQVSPFGNKVNRVLDVSRTDAIQVGHNPGGILLPRAVDFPKAGPYSDNIPNREVGKRRTVEFFGDSDASIRRFPLNSNCASKPNARLFIQVKTNLKEKDNLPPMDDVFGYVGKTHYLDQSRAENVSGIEVDDNNPIEIALWPIFFDWTHSSGKDKFSVDIEARFIE